MLCEVRLNLNYSCPRADEGYSCMHVMFLRLKKFVESLARTCHSVRSVVVESDWRLLLTRCQEISALSGTWSCNAATGYTSLRLNDEQSWSILSCKRCPDHQCQLDHGNSEYGICRSVVAVNYQVPPDIKPQASN